MSGAVAAHASYNGSGTQGLAVTNTLTGTAGSEIQSVFWNTNDTTKQLVYGSAFVEIPANAGSGTSLINTQITQVFDVNNDIDALGDIVLRVTVSSDNASTVKTSPMDVIRLIDRVEVHVGTSIWQTMHGDDLLALAATEMSKGAFDDLALQASGGVSSNGTYTNNGFDSAGKVQVLAADGGAITAFVPLKLYTKTLGPNLENFAEQTESGYLMAAAPSQQVKIKVFTNSGVGTNFVTTEFGSTENSATVSLSLFAKSQVMCSEERNAMNSMANGVPKRIKMSQHVNKDFSGAAVDVDCDAFSLYASHLLITIKDTSGGGGMTSINEAKGEVELLLNSSTYSSKLPLGLLRMAGSSMGLYTNDYTINTTDQGSHVVYVFPLASRAYSGSSVPLNRFDNIRLKFTQLPYSSGKISVTCVGETTALYLNSVASLAMY